MEEKVMSGNFIHDIIDEDNEKGTYAGEVYTRFPPEPNGYLHIGHVKSICLNFGTAKKYGGHCNLRFDDTNPLKEDVEYVESIKNDIEWLGFKWDKCLYASDYFDFMYECALTLIKKGLAFVCDMSADEIKENRGTLTEPGKESPARNRSIEENLELFERMKNGEFADGEKVLRAKIDMASPNINMRDPVIYRIAHSTHHNTGDKWCIYPMYDFAHPLEDAYEGITHSICTLEFEDHRPLYNWVIENCETVSKPKQIEFARLNITNMIMSKRYLKRLVDDGLVDGWDDPRMSTVAGIRRRGYTPASLRNFCDLVGVAKNNSTVDIGLLEYCVREDIKDKVPSKNVALDPVKLIITNYPEGELEYLESDNSATNESLGKRQIPFGRELYVDREDFMAEPVPKYHRLYVGNEVRLRNAYFVTCTGFDKDDAGNVTTIYCTYDPTTKSGTPGGDRKVKGTIHWVEATTAKKITVNQYDYLLLPDENGDLKYNPESVKVYESYAEPSIEQVKAGDRMQFMRKGFYVADEKLYSAESPVFNLIVPLKSSFKLN